MSDLGKFKDSNVVAKRPAPDAVEDQYCGNCQENVRQHKEIGGKCLFGSTNFRLETDAEWKARIELWTESITRQMMGPYGTPQTQLHGSYIIQSVHDSVVIEVTKNIDPGSEGKGR